MLPFLSGGVLYQQLTARYLAATIELATDIWVQHNVIAKAFGVGYAEYRPVASKVCHKAMDDNLAIIAIDTKTDTVIGFDLSMDLVDELENEKSKGSGSVFSMWGAFLLCMLNMYLTTHPEHSKSTPRQVLCHNLIGVLPAYNQAVKAGSVEVKAGSVEVQKAGSVEVQKAGGIGVVLQELAVSLAASLGYRRVLSIATHAASQAISRKLNFYPVGSLLYATCDYPPLRKIKDPTHAIIYAFDIPTSKL